MTTASDAFEWNVNPSTRPVVDGRVGRDPTGPPQPNIPMVNPAGSPAGLTIGMFGCGGPVGSRPTRPSTTGRVDGLTFHSNASDDVVIEYSSRSSNRIGSPMSLPLSSCHTGDVAVWNSLRIVSFDPFGAVPRSTECDSVCAVASSISKYASRLPPLPEPAAWPRPRYSSTTRVVERRVEPVEPDLERVADRAGRPVRPVLGAAAGVVQPEARVVRVAVVRRHLRRRAPSGTARRPGSPCRRSPAGAGRGSSTCGW